MGNEERLEESGLNELTEEQCRVPGQFLDQVAAVNMADIAGRVRKMAGHVRLPASLRWRLPLGGFVADVEGDPQVMMGRLQGKGW